MAIYVHNGTASTMYVALAYHSPNCDGDNWAKMGWWQIGPGGRATVRGGASNGAKYFWYCLLYTSPSPRDISGSRMPSSA